jgi:hypothetical protein
MEVAGFIASWTIGYGLIQAIAPSVIRRSADGLSREVPEARLWGVLLTAIPIALAVTLATGCGFPALPGRASTNDQAKTWDCRVNTMLV